MKKNIFNTIILVSSVMGMILSMYLWSFQGSEQVIPCTNNGCEHVLTSVYSKMFGVSLSVFGFFYYAFLAFVSFQRFFVQHKFIDIVLRLAATWGVIYTLYLRYIEFTKIGAVCMWCWMSVLFVTIITITLYVEYRKSKVVEVVEEHTTKLRPLRTE